MKQYVIEMDERHETELLEELSMGQRASFLELDDFIRETQHGLDPSGIIGEVNAYLERAKMTPALQAPEPMDLEHKKQVVSMANTHFHWIGQEIGHAWFEGDEDVWRSILGNYQELTPPPHG